MKTRLAIVTRNFSKVGGGAESLAVSLATAMLAECDITVVSQGFDQSPALFRHIQIPSLPLRTRWINQLWFSWQSRRLTSAGFDVVHSYENVTHGDVQTISVKTVHASLQQRGMNKVRIALSPRLLAYLWLEKKRMCSPGHHCVFVSQFVHDETLQIVPGIASHSVIPPGVAIPLNVLTAAEKIAARVSLGLDPDIMTLGFVGHDFKKKGLGTLLKAAALLPFDVQIAVFGNTAQAGRYTDLLQSLGVGKSCRFMGVVSDMPSAYAAMDCLAHPTTQDVFPMVVLEAMAMHVPVVTTNAPYNNMGSLLVHQHDAILLSGPDDVEGMAAALRQIWLDADVRLTLATCGFVFARQYSWDAAKVKYYTIYDRVAKSSAVT